MTRKITAFVLLLALPLLLWAALPVTDAFTNTDSTLLSTHNACWTLLAANVDIQSNAAHPAGASVDSWAVWEAACDTLNADQYAQITVSAISATYVGVVARSSEVANTRYNCIGNNSALLLQRFVAGAQTNLATGGPALNVADVVKLEVYDEGVDTRVVCRVNGSIPMGFSVLDLDANDIESGQPGPSGFDNGASGMDDFVADNFTPPAGGAAAGRRIVIQ